MLTLVHGPLSGYIRHQQVVGLVGFEPNMQFVLSELGLPVAVTSRNGSACRNRTGLRALKGPYPTDRRTRHKVVAPPGIEPGLLR